MLNDILKYTFAANRLIWIGAFLLLTTACTTKEILEEIDSPKHLVRVMFSSGGLGDLSFNDGILRGILEEKEKTRFRLYYTVPANIVQAEQILCKWQQEDNPKYDYTILVGSEYAELMKRLQNGKSKSNWLILDASGSNLNITALQYYGYGVSFLTGIAVRRYTPADTVAFMGGMKLDYIEECRQGFEAGFLHAGGQKLLSFYLSDNPVGFALPDRAYILADSLYRKKYPFIYAVAGGSNNGIYQYLRDNPDLTGYTNGVDVDQSAYSDRILGSVIKNVGECAGEYIRKWIQGNPVAGHKICDLQSRNIYFKVAEEYKPALEQILRDSFHVAVNKELEYYESNK